MLRNVGVWLPDYFRQCLKRAALKQKPGPIHIVFTVADHFEPRQGGADKETEILRTREFLARFGGLRKRHHDSTGTAPRYTFFYPTDEYTHECVELLTEACRSGLGEVELHLHHDNDTEESLRSKLMNGVSLLRSHGLLGTDKSGATRYGFVHGNWALCNSARGGRFCGVNDELRILRETGCYADFTLPSAPSETQTAKINSIYYAKSVPETAGAHGRGKDARVWAPPSGHLLMIQGPLMLDWARRKIENGALQASNPVTRGRIDLWVDAGVHVAGREDLIFVKVHNHGCREDQLNQRFFANLDLMFGELEKLSGEGRYVVHYMTAREMYNVIKATETGCKRIPSDNRDFEIVSNIQCQKSQQA